jgi:ABC-2 type transport system permease protein
MRLKWKLTVAALKIFIRQREAIIWTILLPIFMVVLFSLVDFDGIGRLTIGLVDETGGSAEEIVERLKQVRTVELTMGGREAELQKLLDGERDMVLVFTPESPAPLSYVNEASPDEAELAGIVVGSVLNPGLPEGHVALVPTKLRGRDLTYIDFLIPGIIAMSIMQLGIFGVAFSLVSLKKRGILRRLSATPVRPNDFIVGQIVMRLLVVLVQISLLVLVGVIFLDLHFTGNLLEMFVIGVLGAFVFLSMGFAIAGVSSSEDQVAPLANVVAMPMILLSGVFFSRGGLPGIVHSVTDFLPLTYLADGMRAIAIDGARLSEILPDLGGLAVWSVISCLVAVYLFRWE